MQNPPLDKPRTVPLRLKERAQLANLKGIANALNMAAWALEVAISAENKAGVYRVGLHEKLPDAAFKEAYLRVVRINEELKVAVDGLVYTKTIPWSKEQIAFEAWCEAGYPPSEFDKEDELL